MKRSTIYAIALVAGSLGGIVTMISHPTGADLLGQPDEIARRNEMITVAAHSLALISVPVLFFGLTGFSRQIDLERPIVTLALIAYAVAAFAGICAAVINGLVAPSITRQILAADETSKQILQTVLMNNTLINQAFDKIFVVASSFAVVCWSACLLRFGRYAQTVAVFGFVIGAAGFLGILTGHLKMNVHGFGFIIFGQAVWTILLAVFLYRAGDSSGTNEA